MELQLVSCCRSPFVFVIFLAGLVATLFSSYAAVDVTISDNEKFHCLPDIVNETETQCTDRNCVWDKVSGQNKSGPYNPDFPDDRFPIFIGAPSCYYPSDYPSYYYISYDKTNYGFVAYLKRNGSSSFPRDVKYLRMDVFFETGTRLRIKITDSENKRYEVPVPKLPDPPSIAAPVTEYDFTFTYPVGFKITRKSTNETIFDATVGSLIYSDRYLQLSAKLPTTNLYGFAESNDRFKRSFDWQLLPLFTSLFYPDYGSHPFYLLVEGSTKSHGVFLFNSNAMDVILQPLPAVTYRVTGGILDFYFFLGPTPEDVIQQYTFLIGKPALPPYWTLGYHQCKYNYLTVNNTRDVWRRTVDAAIPFDAQWQDIDYMDKYKLFTYDQSSFDTLPQFVEELHSNHMRYVPIMDCGVSVETPGTYPTYDLGTKLDIFIKNDTGGLATGRVWPEHSAFPDFTHSQSSLFWQTSYQSLYEKIKYDGAWIDMNEPSTFSSGSYENTGCPSNSEEDFPPYVPAVEGGSLFAHTICMSSVQQGGSHYNLHNLYGFTEAIATNLAVKAILQKRPFVLSRSTAPGHGFYAAHWTGDVYSKWHDLKQSIPSILNFNLLGIPMVGADICGFRGNTSLQLCQRWTALGAFYPFARNHNENITIEQDPVALGPEMVETARKVLFLRYSLLPFFYTQFYNAHINGGTVVRPLFFEFVDDRNTYDIDEQFLWGSSLMVMPVVEEGATVVTPYIPKGTWYFCPDFRKIQSSGQRMSFDVSFDTIIIALRARSIVVVQSPATTTYASRRNPFGLLVALDETGQAEGELYWDDGDIMDPVEEDSYSHISFLASHNSLTSVVDKLGYLGDVPMVLGFVSVMGLDTKPTHVVVNGKQVEFNYTDAKLLFFELSSTSLTDSSVNVTWNFSQNNPAINLIPQLEVICLAVLTFIIYLHLCQQ